MCARNIRTSSTMCCWATRMRVRRAYLHPIFYGSFDWHSCVHGWWTLLTLRRLFPGNPEAAAIAELADASFTPGKVAAELAYLDRPMSAGFERPYGWGWLLYLHLEASRHEDRAVGDRAGAAGPRLRRAAAHLSRQADLSDPRRHPFQHGVRADPRARMGGAVRSGAGRRDPRLGDREVRRRPRLPGVGAGRRRVPFAGADRGAVHGAGAARRRVRQLVRGLPAAPRRPRSPRPCSCRPRSATAATARSPISTGSTSAAPGAGGRLRRCCRDEERAVAEATAEEHLAAALPHVAGDYMGEHWLASFALLAMLAYADLA